MIPSQQIEVGAVVYLHGHYNKPDGIVTEADPIAGTVTVEFLNKKLLPPSMTLGSAEVTLGYSPNRIRCVCGGSSAYGDSDEPNSIYHDHYCPLSKER